MTNLQKKWLVIWMADMKEKLVEIIQNSVGGCARYWAEVIADGLIANGVTVQKWISVKDRLPERYKYILLWDTMDRDIFMGVLDDKREWYVPGYDEPFNITHWMPLPEAPKEGDGNES